MEKIETYRFDALKAKSFAEECISISNEKLRIENIKIEVKSNKDLPYFLNKTLKAIKAAAKEGEHETYYYGNMFNFLHSWNDTVALKVAEKLNAMSFETKIGKHLTEFFDYIPKIHIYWK